MNLENSHSEQARSEQTEPDSVGDGRSGKIAGLLEFYLAIAFVLFALLMGIMIRMTHFLEPLWLDELHTRWVVSGHWSQVSERATIGNQSPLYFFLVKSAESIQQSNNDLSIRTVSMICGIVLIPLATACAFLWTRSFLLAGTVAVIVAFDPNFVFYATEARPFALLQAITVIHLMVLHRMLVASIHGAVAPIASKKFASPWELAWIALSVLGFYVHYTYAVMIAAQLISLVFNFVLQKQWRHVLRILISVLFILFFLFPALVHCAEIWSRRGDWGTVVNWEQTWLQLRTSVFIVLVLPVWSIAAFLLIARPRQRTGDRDDKELRDAIVLTIAFTLLLGIAFLMNADGILVPRYQQPLCLWLLFAIPLMIKMCQSQNLIRTVGVLVFTAALVGYQDPIRWLANKEIAPFRNEQWSALESYVSDALQRDSVTVILLPGLLEDHRLNDAHSEKFHEYTMFPFLPFANIKSVAGRIHACASEDPQLGQDLMDQVRGSKELIIVVRGGLENAYRVHGLIGSQLQQAGLTEPSVRFNYPGEYGELSYIEFDWRTP